jgi:hypothetical protein
MASCRGDQAIEQVGVLDYVAAGERVDDALDVAAAPAGVLDEIELFVGSDLVDADAHGPIPDYSQPPRRIDRRQGFLLIFSAKAGRF